MRWRVTTLLLVYDITTPEAAQVTYAELKQGNIGERDIKFRFMHCTTRLGDIEKVKNDGLNDLVTALETAGTDLHDFLATYGIFITPNQTIKLKGKEISFKELKDKNRFLYNRLTNDTMICGFLLYNQNQVYSANVHERPEVLKNINELMNLEFNLDINLEEDWQSLCKPYTVYVELNATKTTFFNDYKKEAINYLLVCALDAAKGNTFDEFIYLKRDQKVDTKEIVKVEPRSIW